VEQKPELANEYVPSAHTSQEVLMPSPAFPASQASHSVSDVDVQAEEMKEPTPHTSQDSHEGWLDSDWYSSSPHATHESLPPADDVPAGHSSQLLEVESARLPGPQNVHELWPSLLLTKPFVASQLVHEAAAAPDTSPTEQSEQTPALVLL
jgi:hypothetical protein